MTRAIAGCPACGGSDIERNVYTQDGAFVSSALLYDAPRRPAAKAPIRLAFCRGCGLVYNAAFRPATSAAYSSVSYRLKAVLPGGMSRNLEQVLGALLPRLPAGGVAVEVGSGSGALAAGLARRAGRVCTVDPSAAAARAPRARNMRHFAEYFSADTARRLPRADLLVARHLIEHLPRPGDFFASAAAVLKDEGRLYLEFPDFREIARSGRCYDIFNDHVAYYSPASLANAAAGYGFAPAGKVSYFGGQHAGLFFRKTGAARRRRPAAYDLSALLRSRAGLRALPAGLPGPLAVYGAGAHGAALWSCLSARGRAAVAFFLDKDPAKQGLYIPGSGARVLPPSAENLRRAGSVVMAAALYEKEIYSMLRRSGFAGPVLLTSKGLKRADLLS